MAIPPPDPPEGMAEDKLAEAFSDVAKDFTATVNLDPDARLWVERNIEIAAARASGTGAIPDEPTARVFALTYFPLLLKTPPSGGSGAGEPITAAALERSYATFAFWPFTRKSAIDPVG